MKLGWQPAKWLEKKARAGARGHPIGTIAFYGPDNTRASKAAVGIRFQPDQEVTELRRWLSDAGDVRNDAATLVEIVAYLREQEVRSVMKVDRIIGCPHEDGIDYPHGGICPHCPYWENRDRWTGRLTKP